MTRRIHQRGFTFLWVVVAIAILGVGLLAVSEVWVTNARREKLAELDWVGAQFTEAIGSYYYATPASVKAYPQDLRDLIEDHRYGTVRRHLREIYVNPFTGVPNWETVSSPNGGIQGVRANVPSDSGTTVKEFLFKP
jgi:prepilin-type N-terminal cleavage/methylation domain-containing protein